MLEFKQSDISVKIILTLTEFVTLPGSDYYFVFTHVLTKDQVTLTKLNGDDESLYPGRYNKFTFNPSVLFLGKQPGEWHYKVYENNVSGEILEQGKMILDRATAFEFKKYDSQTSFKTYNG